MPQPTFIVVLALVALRDRRRVERDLPVRHPDWPMLAAVGSLYALIVAAMIAGAAGRDGSGRASGLPVIAGRRLR